MTVMTTSEKFSILSGLKLGDKVLLTDGSIAEFTKLNRKNFSGVINGSSFSIPVEMFVSITERANVNDRLAAINDLKRGDLFYINKKGSALLFQFEKMQGVKILGINPISKTPTTIEKTMFVAKL